ncbi:Calpain [Hondaea fermentalgiana]|uniref:Calpain n=1 Tax=Hondaea fermentalgiana TaxID=2315210 RepID=A0A2R5GUF5_9STRA|nr:Calpain [Hondaea fermentalgiana]|eukprot:GBG34480.1 Calpain [Hondaea fermentalgiana]
MRHCKLGLVLAALVSLAAVALMEAATSSCARLNRFDGGEDDAQCGACFPEHVSGSDAGPCRLRDFGLVPRMAEGPAVAEDDIFSTRSIARFVDLNNDGLLDMVAATYSSSKFSYYENVGTASMPSFEKTTSNSPVQDFPNNINFDAQVAFGDFTADGFPDAIVFSAFTDLDLSSSANDQKKVSLFVWSETEDKLVEAPSADIHPLQDLDGYIIRVMHLVDLNGDGKLDVLAATGGNEVLFLENTGSSESPTWTKSTLQFDVSAFSSTIQDIDTRPRQLPISDRVQDILVTDYSNNLYVLMNEGTADAPAFAKARTADGEVFSLVDDWPEDPNANLNRLVTSIASVNLFDKDTEDFVVVQAQTTPLIRVLSQIPREVSWTLVNGDADLFANLSSLVYVAPTFFDMDGDGDLDLIAGQATHASTGDIFTFKYFRNDWPSGFVEQSNEAGNPIANLTLGENIYYEEGAQASFFVSETSNETYMVLSDTTARSSLLYKRQGETFAKLEQMAFPDFGISLARNIQFVKFNASGPLQAYTIGTKIKQQHNNLQVKAYEFVSEDADPMFRELDAPAFEFPDEIIGQLEPLVRDGGSWNPNIVLYPTLSLGDMDNDGDVDVFFSVNPNSIFMWENRGTPETPDFSDSSYLTEMSLPKEDGTDWSSDEPMVAVADVDGDGDLDLVTVDQKGSYLYYVSTQSDCASQTPASLNRGECAQGRVPTEDIFTDVTNQKELEDASYSPGLWLCTTNFIGNSCERCAVGMYGPDCSQRCPTGTTTNDTLGWGVYPNFATIEDCQCSGALVRQGDECTCPPGYEFSNASGTDACVNGTDACVKCGRGTYKSGYGLEPCEKCPYGDYSDTMEMQNGINKTITGADNVSLCSCRESFDLDNETNTCLCMPGQSLDVDGQLCLPCALGSYTRGMNLAESCELCAEGLDTEHFWRIAATSIDLRECPSKAYCVPMNETEDHRRLQSLDFGDQYCSEHHTGTLCASCVEGYAKNEALQCAACDGPREAADKARLSFWILLAVFITMAPAFLVVLSTASATKNKQRRRRKKGKFNTNLTTCFLQISEFFTQAFSSCPGSKFVRCWWDAMNHKTSIFLKFAQIVVEVSAIVGIIGAGGSTADFLTNMNLGQLLKVFPLGCVITVDLYTTMLVSTMWPFAMALLVGLTVALRRYCSGNETSTKRVAIGVSTEILAFIYPGVSSTILSVFVMDNVNREQGDENPFRPLFRDPTIDFDDPKSTYWRIYAGVMVAVYPIGVLLLFIIGFFFKHRHSVECHGAKSVLVQAVAHLERPYRDGYGWYACLELVRRLALTSGFLLVQMISFEDAASFFIACNIVFITAIASIFPYRVRNDNLFAILSQLLLCMFALGVQRVGRIRVVDKSTAPFVARAIGLEVFFFFGTSLHQAIYMDVETFSPRDDNDDFLANGSDNNREEEEQASRGYGGFGFPTSLISEELELTRTDDAFRTPPNSPRNKSSVDDVDGAVINIDVEPANPERTSRLPATLSIDHHAAAEFERWPLERVRKTLQRWRRDHDETALRTNALTEEEVVDLLMDDHGQDRWNSGQGIQLCDSNNSIGPAASSNESERKGHDDDDELSSAYTISTFEGWQGNNTKRTKKPRIKHETLTKFQAHVRGRMSRRKVKTWRNLREETYFEGPSGSRRILDFFELFCSAHDTANPFDGRKTIDVLRFFAGLALLCQGKSSDKADLLLEIFAGLAPLHEAELTIMLIIISHAIVHVYTDPTLANELSMGTDEDVLEGLAQRIFRATRMASANAFCTWAIANRPLAEWAARTCEDVKIFEFVLNADRWAVVTVEDSPHDSQNQWPLGSPAIALFGKLPNASPISYVSPASPLQCLVVHAKQVQEAEEIWIGLLDDNGRTTVASARTSSRARPNASVGVHNEEFPRGMAQAFPFEVAAEHWTPQDTIGIFDRACPMGSYGAFFEQSLHRALFQQQVVSFENFPRPESKLVWFDDSAQEAPRYLHFGFGKDLVQVPYAQLVTSRSQTSFIEGDAVLARVNVQRQVPCACKGSCGPTCAWVKGSVVEAASESKLKVRFVRKEDSDSSVEEYDFSSFLTPSRIFPLAQAGKVPVNGDRLLCQRPSSTWEFFPCVVIDSGWLELRYIKGTESAAATSKQGRLCVARSRSFRLNLAPFELGDLIGTRVDEHIHCKLEFIRPEYVDASHDGDYVGLFSKHEPLSQLVPANSDLTVKVEKRHLEQASLTFDAYFFKSSRGGVFEARFFHKGAVASVSRPLFLRPLVILRDVYQEGHGFVIGQAPRMTCQLEVIDESAWTCWDRVELVAVNAQDGTESEPLGWAYVSAQRRDAQRAGIDVPETLVPGCYRWKYSGFYPETCELGKTFEVCILTEEDRLADLPPDEREEKIAADRKQRLNLLRQASSIRLQSWTRGHRVRKNVQAELNSKREQKATLEANLTEARAVLADIEKSNKRRSSNLVSRRDRERQEDAKSTVDYLEDQLAQLTAGVSAEQLEDERARIDELREISAQERQEQEENNAHEREMDRRRKLRSAREVRTWPFAFPSENGLCLDTTSSLAAAELAQWVETEGRLFTDEEFRPTLASIKDPGNAWMTYVIGSTGRDGSDGQADAQECGLVDSLVWLRPSTLFAGMGGRNEAVPLVPEKLYWRKIPEPSRHMAPEALARLEPFQMALMTLAEHSPHIVSNIIDATYAHLGMYTVKLFLKDSWKAITLDDQLPALARERGTTPLLTSANPFEVGLWVFLLEKAVAKAFGSYESAFANIESVPAALALLTGGFACSFDLASKDLFPGAEFDAWEETRPAVHASRPQGVTMPLFAAPNRVSDDDMGVIGMLKSLENRLPNLDCFSFARTGGVDCFHVQIVGIHAPSDESESFIRLRKVLGQDEEPLGRRWRWHGKWADDDEEHWTEEMRAQVSEFDPIGDGSIWMTISDFSNTFASWGFCATAKAGAMCASGTAVVEWKCSLRTCGGPRYPRAFENPVVDIEADAETLFVQLVSDHALTEVRVVQMHLSDERPHIDVLRPEAMGAAIWLRPNASMASTYRLQLQLWAPGLETLCTLRVCAIGATGKRIAVVAEDQHLTLCKSEKEAILATPDVLMLRGFPTPRPGNLHCAACGLFMGPAEDTVVLKGGARWHIACATNCSSCGQVADVMFLDRASQDMRPTCKNCWDDNYADACLECQEKGPPALVSPEVLKDPEHVALPACEALLDLVDIPKSVQSLNGDCEGCAFRERLAAADKCRHCGIAMLPDCMELVPKDKPKLHAVCQQAHIEAKSPTCAFCEAPICAIEGKFSGVPKKCRLGIVHEECYAQALAAAGRRKS